VPILIACECGRQYRTDDSNMGREARCAVCGRILTVASSPPIDEPWLTTEPIGRPCSGRAIASLALGALSLVVSVFAGLPAIVLGCMGVGDIRRSRGRLRGEYLAMGGIALGIVGSTVVPLVAVGVTIGSIRESARLSRCTYNLKQIGLALHTFHNAHNGFPAAAIYDRKGQPLLSWRVAILPYLGTKEAALFEKFQLKEPWDSPHNRTLLAEMPQVYRCPLDAGPHPGLTPYQVVVGPGTLFDGRKRARYEDSRRGKGTFCLAIEADDPVPWTAPTDVPFDPADDYAMSGTHHHGAYHYLHANGAVSILTKSEAPVAPVASPSRVPVKFRNP
jgi:hypothetical protein